MSVTTPKLLPCSPHGPKQVGIGLGRHSTEFTVGGDDLQGPDMVGTEPESTTEDPDPPAEAVGNGADRWR